jgi:hypothetical protein
MMHSWYACITHPSEPVPARNADPDLLENTSKNKSKSRQGRSPLAPASQSPVFRPWLVQTSAAHNQSREARQKQRSSFLARMEPSWHVATAGLGAASAQLSLALERVLHTNGCSAFPAKAVTVVRSLLQFSDIALH